MSGPTNELRAETATQAANVESRIKAIERIGQHGTMPGYWRNPLALAFAADEVAGKALLDRLDRLDQLEAVAAAARQYLDTGRGDLDGALAALPSPAKETYTDG